MADKHLGAIEQEMEATRERLAATIDQLAHRANPKTIAAREVGSLKGFFVDPGGSPRADNIAKVVGGVVGVIVVLTVIRKLVG